MSVAVLAIVATTAVLARMSTWHTGRDVATLQAAMPPIHEFARVLRGYVCPEGPTNIAGEIRPTYVELPATIEAQDEIAYYEFDFNKGRLLVIIDYIGNSDSISIVRVGVWEGTSPRFGRGVLRACGTHVRATARVREAKTLVIQVENPPRHQDGRSPGYPGVYRVRIRRWKPWKDVWRDGPFWATRPDTC